MPMAEKSARGARIFMRSHFVGVLSTHSLELEGYPFGSVTPYALTQEGNPILLISLIAQHTKNITANPKVCLTVMDEKSKDKQAHPRASLIGDAQIISDQPESKALKKRYLDFFPEHENYFKTHHFLFCQIIPVRIRFIGGFAKIHWIEKEEWQLGAPAWKLEEQNIIDHMNQEHGDSLRNISRHFCNIRTNSVKMTALDEEGFHIRNDAGISYLPFDSPCRGVKEVREEMVRLSREAK